MERTELMEKALKADYSSLKALGWLEVFEALKGWWPKRMNIEDLAPYLDALYEEKASKVMDTLRGMRGEQWRPSPSMLYREIQGIEAKKRQRHDAPQDQYGQRKRDDQMPSALVQVRLLIDSGHHVCNCSPRSPTVIKDSLCVLRCKACGGLEQGQVFEAEDDLDF